MPTRLRLPELSSYVCSSAVETSVARCAGLIEQLNGSFARPIDTIGLEARVAYRLLYGRDRNHRHRMDRVLAARRKLSSLLVRPCSEVVALQKWQQFRSWQINAAQLEALNAGLIGGTARRSSVAMHGSAGNGADEVCFLDPDESSNAINRIREIGDRPDLSGIELASIIYLTLIISHPYEDGNGRLARLLVTGALARRGGLCVPALALSPACYFFAPELSRAVGDLSRTTDWTPAVEVVAGVIQHAMTLALDDVESRVAM